MNLRKFALIPLLVLILALIAGCSMAAPGVASISAPPPPGGRKTTYDNSWVNQPPNPTDNLPENQHMSVDISERELGDPWWIDEDGNKKPRRKPGYEERQEKRQAERRAVIKERMGIKTMKDEQKEREEAGK